jgi:hypothetical protein
MKFSTEADGEEKRKVNVPLTYDVFFVTAHPCIPSPHAEIVKTPTSPSFQNLDQTPSPSPTSTLKFSGKSSPPTICFPIEGELRKRSRERLTRETGHPLHKAYTYTKLPLLTLLSLPNTTPFTTLLSPPTSPSSTAPYLSDSTTHTTSSTIPKVLVIDCTDSSMTQFPLRPGISPVGSENGSRGSGEKGSWGVKKRGSDLEILVRAVCAERGWNALISRRGRGCLACAIREAGALGWRVIIRVA